MWPEIELAKKENRHEIVLFGTEISNRLARTGLDTALFHLINLNYLDLHETTLAELPDQIHHLANLQTLVLHSNRLTAINPHVGKLTKLKFLDLSRNALRDAPPELDNLTQLVTLNLSSNQLETFPRLCKLSKLAVVFLSNNKLQSFPDICHDTLTNLSELKLSCNEIPQIPGEIGKLTQLKVLDVASNRIAAVTGEVAGCGKLKELNLKQNPITDRRLLKLIDQCRTKQILDYIKQNSAKASPAAAIAPVVGATVDDNDSGATTKSSKQNDSDSDEQERTCRYNIRVRAAHKDDMKVVILNSVKNVREHFVGCLIENVQFTAETFKKFIQLQNKLHDTVCGKRSFSTIATHDYKKLLPGPLTYTTMAPNDLLIRPLNRHKTMTASELFNKLQVEANNLRKEKKRSTYSGIHKYLCLIEGRPLYPCVLNSRNEVVSFPPITNSDLSKIDLQTTTIFVEVTSSTSQDICKAALDAMLKDMVTLFDDGKDLDVKQLRTVDVDGNLKVVYPSRSDLKFEKNVDIKVVRD